MDGIRREVSAKAHRPPFGTMGRTGIFRRVTRGVIKRVALSSLSRLPDSYRRRLFYALARELGVTMLEIQGRNGVFTGYVRDLIFMHYVLDNTWSAEMCAIARGVFEGKPAGTFLDIGANIGLTFVPVAQNPAITCFAFEPEPRNFALLQKNVAQNDPKAHVELYNIALFDRSGTIEFELSPDNLGDHRVRNQTPAHGAVFREHERDVIAVASKRLDELLDISTIAAPVVVKLDTQGAEQHIYDGGRALFSYADVLMIEFWPYGIERMGGSAERLIKAIEGDYRYGCFLEPGRVPVRGDLREITEIATTMRRLADDPQITFHDIKTHDVVLTKQRSNLAN